MQKLKRSMKVLALCAAVGFVAEVFAGWTYNSGAGLLTDGNWQLAATVKNGQLTITGLVSGSTAYETLDLRDPVVDDGNVETVYSVVSFGSKAFYQNATLATLYLPDTITTIGGSAFQGCTALTTVSPLLPDSVTYLDGSCFNGCTALTGVLRLGFGTGAVTCKGNEFISTAIEEAYLGEKVTTCPNLSKCASLRKLSWHDGIKSIAGFSGCSSLVDISPFVPTGITHFTQNAFASVPVTNDLYFGFGDGPDYTYTYGGQFSKIGSRIIKIGPRAKSLPTGGFGGSAVEELTLSEGVASLSDAFGNCPSLTNVINFLPSTVSSIGQRGFYNSSIETPLVSTYPGDLTLSSKASWGTFWSCKKLPSADFSQSGMTALRNATFQGCTAMGWLKLPPTLMTFESSAINGCTAMSNVVFYGKCPTTLSDSAFSGVADYKLRMYVPRFFDTWERFAAEKVSPLDATATSKWQTAYPDEPLPQGVIVSDGKYVFYCDRFPGEHDKAYVTGDPCWIGAAEGVTYGNFDVTAAQTFTVPATTLHEGEMYRCMGYRLDVETAADTWANVSAEGGPSCTVSPDAQGRNQRLTWLWARDGFSIKITAYGDGICGTAEIEPEKEMYVEGDVVTITATPASGMRFLRWVGDLPDEALRTSPVLSDLEPKEAMDLTAVFESDHWIYDSSTSATTMTDGNWTLGVSVKDGVVTVTSVLAVGSPDAVDLTKPIDGGLTVGAIGASAFKSCAGLVEVLLPETLTTIGNYAFEECASLKSVKPMFPASVVSLGARAFYSCSSLTGAVSLVGASLSLAQDTNYGTFQYTKINSIVITAPLVSTPRGMCANCSALEFAELPDTVTSLGENTFANSTALKRVRLSNNLTSIGMSAFWACSALQEVKPFLPATVKGIGGTAFYNCTSLTNDLYLVSTNAVGFGKNNNQGSSGMFGGTKIGKLVITSPITGFGDSPVLFSGCKSLKYVEFPETLTTMRGDMFNSCSALSEMYFRGDRPDNLAPSLGSVSDYVLRIYVPKTGSGWDALPSGTVTAWNDLDSSVQKQFSDRYSGKHPYALWNIATKKDIWLIYWNPKPTGMKILFR